MLSLPHPLFGLQTDSILSCDMPTSRRQHCQILAEATLYFPLQTQGAAAISPVVSIYGGRFWVIVSFFQASILGDWLIP